jgi:hypothetical protein
MPKIDENSIKLAWVFVKENYGTKIDDDLIILENETKEN